MHVQTSYSALEDKGVKLAGEENSKQEYKVLCMGNSARDLVVIPLVLVTLYAVVGVYFTLLLRAVTQTDNTDAALWMFFFIFFVLAMMLAFALNMVAYVKQQHKKHNGDGDDEL